MEEMLQGAIEAMGEYREQAESKQGRHTEQADAEF
jgi:hypothetical protein